jgi:integrase
VETPLKRLGERPQVKKLAEPRVLTDEEIEGLLDHALPSYRPLLATAVFTGLRLSELLALRWQGVNFDEGVIHVRHQLSRSRPPRLVPLKTGAGRRDVVLLPRLAAILRQHKQGNQDGVVALRRPEGFVFVNRDGGPMYYRRVQSRGIELAAKRAGLNGEGQPRLTMHQLRHTFASHLIRAGVDPVRVSKQLGHARVSITLDVYSHEFERQHGNDLRQQLTASGFGLVAAD